MNTGKHQSPATFKARGDTPIAPSNTPLQVEGGICIAVLNA